MKSGKEQRFEMTAEDIDLLVKNFYSEVRKEPILGPVFHNAIGFEAEKWGLHEEKIASFWRKAISIDDEYRGNPMKTHIANPDI